MSKRQLLVLWSIVLLLASGVLIVKLGQDLRHSEATKRTRGQTLFERFPAEDIASISLESATDKTTLLKTGSGWTITERGGYPADSRLVQELLRHLDSLKITQGIDADTSYFPRFGITTDSSTPAERGITVVFRNKDQKEVAGIVLGKLLETGEPMSGGISGRYIRNLADTSGVYVVNETFPSTTASPKSWLPELSLNIEKPISIEVTEPGKHDQTAWKITRSDESTPFTLEGITATEKLDASLITPLQNLLSYARFSDVISDVKPAEVAARKDARTARISTLEGFTYSLNFAPHAVGKANTPGSSLLSFQVEAKLPDKRQKPENEKPEDTVKHDEAFASRLEQLKRKLANEQQLSLHVFEVSDWTLGSLLKSRTELLLKPKAATNPTQATTPPMLLPR